MPDGPNPLRVALSIIRALRTRRPAPRGTATVLHDRLVPVLDALRANGVEALPDMDGEISLYRKEIQEVDPDTLHRDDALGYWLNLYNAGALHLAAEAVTASQATVLRVPGGFSRPWAFVAGEHLSLDDIEHGKIRRFQDPRIHGALVCGSVSCPTLRYEPYQGETIDEQLDQQMRDFLANGGAVVDRSTNSLLVSRVVQWFSGDFAWPRRMPTFLPARRSTVVRSLRVWLDADVTAWIDETSPRIAYQPYDWSLACTIR